MDENITRDDLLRLAGLGALGGAAALAVPGAAQAQTSSSQAYIQGYVRATGLPTLLVQGSAFTVPVQAAGTTGLSPLGADPVTGKKGIGFDIEFGAAVVGDNSDKNKGKDPSFCLLEFTQGALNGFPPINSAGGSLATPPGVDAIRLAGTVIEAGDPANLGVAVTLHAFSGLVVIAGHNICRIRFTFGPFGPWWGVGLALVNT